MTRPWEELERLLIEGYPDDHPEVVRLERMKLESLSKSEILDEMNCDLAAEVPIEVVEPKMSEWQPIDTVPSDTYVLLYSERGRQFAHSYTFSGMWSERDQAFYTIPYLHEVKECLYWRELPASPFDGKAMLKIQIEKSENMDNLNKVIKLLELIRLDTYDSLDSID